MAKGWKKENGRTEVFQIRLTPEEKKQAEYLAYCFDKPLAEYIRGLLSVQYAELKNKDVKIEIL